MRRGIPPRARHGARAPPSSRSRRSTEVDNAADAVLGFHELDAFVDFIQGELVRDEWGAGDVARGVALEKRRHLVTSLDAAEGRAGDPSAGDEKARDDV